MYSDERLSRTEISTLVGLLLKGALDLQCPDTQTMERFVTETEHLLAELHEAIAAPLLGALDAKPEGKDLPDPFANGEQFREPIFYGGESAYDFQYRDLTPKKYARDSDWLIANKGFAMDSAMAVLRAIAEVQERNIESFFAGARSGAHTGWSLLPCFTVRAADVAVSAGLGQEVAEAILAAFSVPTGSRNATFSTVSDFNIANAFPLIQTPSGDFILFQHYSLAEALYETPFFWMGADRKYASSAMKHRGQFTEEFAAERLRHVFTEEHVHPNVTIFDKRGQMAGEIDVLVLFGDRAVVLQAKSKRLTIEARKGNDKQIRDDFRKTIQDSYDQGYTCAELLRNPAYRFKDNTSHELKIPKLKEVYLLCAISDHYPALSLQSRHLLTLKGGERPVAPFVLDLFTLDAVTEMLSSPLLFLSYVARRTGYNDLLCSSHELTLLSYHLTRNLWFDDEYNQVMFADDVAADLDVCMAARRGVLPGKQTPDGLLMWLSSTTLGKVIQQIEDRPHPATLALGYQLLTVNGEAIQRISRGMDTVMHLARTDRRPHDMTVPAKDSSVGITIHCNEDRDQLAMARLEYHCENRKYIHQASRWFGLCLSPDGRIRFGVNLESTWAPSASMDARTRDMQNAPVVRKSKLGRNDPCWCGSGKKYKKCCLDR
jgi:hypothetical protein